MTDPLLGLFVRLARSTDRQCSCGNTMVILRAASEPHGNEMRCATCNHHHGWLPKVAATFLKESIRVFGVPREPITFDDATIPMGTGKPPLIALAMIGRRP
jgi:hypothetical protein